MFEDGFNVKKDNSLNPTGRHRLTGKAAVFLKDGSYLEGAWNRNCTQQGPNDSNPVGITCGFVAGDVGFYLGV